MKNKITLDDIAREAGVTKNTVSVALRGKPGVSEELRARITELAERMNYIKSGTAPVSQNRHILALFAGSVASYAQVNLSDGLMTSGLIPRLYFQLLMVAQSKGYMVSTYALDEKTVRSCELPPILREVRFDAVVTFGRMEKNYLERLISEGLHVVMVHERVDGIRADAVTGDDCYAGYVMTEHLILQGHRDIAFFGEKYYMAKYMDRWYGYCRAMVRYGLPFETNSYNEADITRQTEEQEFANIKKALSEMKTMPTAIVCGEDFTATRLRNCLSAQGIRCPEDVSLVGFDDVYPDTSDFRITTYRADHEAIIRCVMQRIQQPDGIPQVITVYGRPVYRSSSVQKRNG